MKVLIVSRWLWEERRRNGGAPGFFGELFAAIARKGVDLMILSQASDAGAEPEPRSIDGLDVHVFSREGRRPALALADKGIKLWAGYRKAVTDAEVIRRFARSHGPFDAIVAQCEEPDGLSCALASLAKDLPPLVTCVHDLRYRFGAKGVRFTRKSSLGFVFRQSARILANSEQTAEWLQREYAVSGEKIGQCRIHLTAPFLQVAGEKSPDASTAEKRILFLGALNRKKAPDVFLRSAIKLAPRLPGWTFVLVGPETSEDRAFRETLAGLEGNPILADCLESPGRLEPAAVIEQIRRAHVVVCPSRVETFSRTTIEALALDRPVVVTETTGAAQWVRSTGAGSIVPPDDPSALAEAIFGWTAREVPRGTSTAVCAQLTAGLAADDWIAELRRVVTPLP